VQFLLYTHWLPQRSTPSAIGVRELALNCPVELGPLPADLGYHSKTPHYEGHTSMGACEFCDGQDCYYDGSGLNANDAMYALLNGGDDALWKFLDEYYRTVFEDAAYPTPAEYPMPERLKASKRVRLEKVE
jgi:hypothetical protein